MTSIFSLTRVTFYQFVVYNEYIDFIKSKVMNKLIDDFENIDFIRDFERTFGSLLLLAVKPHQERCKDVHFSFRDFLSVIAR